MSKGEKDNNICNKLQREFKMGSAVLSAIKHLFC